MRNQFTVMLVKCHRGYWGHDKGLGVREGEGGGSGVFYLFSRELGGELVGVGNPRRVPHFAA